MSDVILHHYPGSPFAEKIRSLLGNRQLPWHSVIIPAIMPKPDVTALTGGYRKTPVMQIGADIYCDTALIARKLDELSAEPTLYPQAQVFTAQTIATWADTTLFPLAVTLVFQPEVIQNRFGSKEEAQAFLADRMALRKNGTQRKITLAEATTVFDNCLRDLEQQLSDGRSFLLGDQPTIADFAVYHPLWFVRNAAIIHKKIEPYGKLTEWLDRIKGFGHGQSEELPSSEAVAIANSSEIQAGAASSNIDGIEVGDKVEVSPADYGMDPVAGTLHRADADELILLRRDERAGEVAVHFPRFCYSIQKQQG